MTRIYVNSLKSQYLQAQYFFYNNISIKLKPCFQIADRRFIELYTWLSLTYYFLLMIIRGRSLIFFEIESAAVLDLSSISLFSFYSVMVRRAAMRLRLKINRPEIRAFSLDSRDRKKVSLENIFEKNRIVLILYKLELNWGCGKQDYVAKKYEL